MAHLDPDTMSQSSQPSASQADNLEIPVRTKGPELIGRVACVLWVYCHGMF